MVACRGVGDNLDAIHEVLEVRALNHPHLLADLTADLGVQASHYGIAHPHSRLPLDVVYDLGELEINNSVSIVKGPRLEPPPLSIVVSASHLQLRSNENDLLVKAEDPAVEKSVFVDNWHPNVDQNVFSEGLVPKNVCKHLPRVSHRVHLKEVVLTAVSSDLKLRSNSVARPHSLGLLDGLNNIVLVVQEGHGPLVERARRKLGEGLVHFSKLII
mmetsp:Transcript_11418/g.19284  ORF Transcript_11418/g.19284 Transcript_11418/m.19284 type:complete len:215 (-) Transcript_11418:14-658(-)